MKINLSAQALEAQGLGYPLDEMFALNEVIKLLKGALKEAKTYKKRRKEILNINRDQGLCKPRRGKWIDDLYAYNEVRLYLHPTLWLVHESLSKDPDNPIRRCLDKR